MRTTAGFRVLAPWLAAGLLALAPQLAAAHAGHDGGGHPSQAGKKAVQVEPHAGHSAPSSAWLPTCPAGPGQGCCCTRPPACPGGAVLSLVAGGGWHRFAPPLLSRAFRVRADSSPRSRLASTSAVPRAPPALS